MTSVQGGRNERVVLESTIAIENWGTAALLALALQRLSLTLSTQRSLLKRVVFRRIPFDPKVLFQVLGVLGW